MIYRIEEWPPHQHITRLRDGLLAEWVKQAQAGWDQTKEKEYARAYRLFIEYRTSLKVAAEYSRAWGLDPTPCYQFAEVDQKPDSRFFERFRRQLADFILKCVEEAEVQWRLIGGENGDGVDPESIGILRVISKPGEWLKILPRHFWEPFYRSAKVMNLLPDWYELTKRLGHHTDDERMQYEFLRHELAEALRALSVRAQTMGLNVDAIYKFQQFDGGKTLTDIRNAMGELTNFIHRYEDTAEAGYQMLKAEGRAPDDLCPPPPPQHSPAPAAVRPASEGVASAANAVPADDVVKPDPIALAVTLKSTNPGWSDRQVAKAAGCSPSTLSRSKVYQRVKQMCAGDAPPRGSKNGTTGDIEAFDE